MIQLFNSYCCRISTETRSRRERGESLVVFSLRSPRLCVSNARPRALRDALLPKLISGELRVPDAERIVGRAV